MTEAVRVVAGRPTPEELAVVLAVLAAAGAGRQTDGSAGRRSRWTTQPRLARSTLTVGPGSWRASALPR